VLCPILGGGWDCHLLADKGRCEGPGMIHPILSWAACVPIHRFRTSKALDDFPGFLPTVLHSRFAKTGPVQKYRTTETVRVNKAEQPRDKEGSVPTKEGRQKNRHIPIWGS